MGDDLIEIIAAMVEWLRQILAEEPIEQTGAAHHRQRQSHQSSRAFEDQHRKQRADRKIGARRIAVAGDQVGVENPLIQPAQEACAAGQPAERPAEIALGGEVADQAESHQQQEADVNAAHDLARQIIERGDVELEGSKDDADGIGEIAPAAGAEARRKTVLEIVELDLDGLFRPLGLSHVRDSLPAPVRGAQRRSNPWRRKWRNGLLRCARNDGGPLTSSRPFPCSSGSRRGAAAPGCRSRPSQA